MMQRYKLNSNFKALYYIILFFVALIVFSSSKPLSYLCGMKQVFNISLPTSWGELSDKQLHMVYNLFARDLSAAEVKTLCLMKWNGLKVLASLSDKRFLIKREKEPEVALSTRQIQQATSRQIQQATSVLDFLADNIGQSFVGVVAKALDDNYRRYNH